MLLNLLLYLLQSSDDGAMASPLSSSSTLLIDNKHLVERLQVRRHYVRSLNDVTGHVVHVLLAQKVCSN